jgi:penicillin-binding protein 1A
VMRDATISVEDRRFRSHLGVDPIGVARSIKVRWDRGRFTQGGSTITQQLARTVFLNNQKKFARKFQEAILALAIEREFTKDQILELYLNKVYYGGGAYGIDAASRKFFGHGADHLSQGAVQLFTDRRRRSCGRPRRRRHQDDGRDGCDHRIASRRGRY